MGLEGVVVVLYEAHSLSSQHSHDTSSQTQRGQMPCSSIALVCLRCAVRCSLTSALFHVLCVAVANGGTVDLL